MKATKPKQCKLDDSDEMMDISVVAERGSGSFSRPSDLITEHDQSPSRWRDINPLDTCTTKKSKTQMTKNLSVTNFNDIPRETNVLFKNLNKELEEYYDRSTYGKICLNPNPMSEYKEASPNFRLLAKTRISKNATLLRDFLQNKFKGRNSQERYSDIANLYHSKEVTKSTSCSNLFQRRATQMCPFVKRIDILNDDDSCLQEPEPKESKEHKEWDKENLMKKFQSEWRKAGSFNENCEEDTDESLEAKIKQRLARMHSNGKFLSGKNKWNKKMTHALLREKNGSTVQVSKLISLRSGKFRRESQGSKRIKANKSFTKIKKTHSKVRLLVHPTSQKKPSRYPFKISNQTQKSQNQASSIPKSLKPSNSSLLTQKAILEYLNTSKKYKKTSPALTTKYMFKISKILEAHKHPL
ncbi:unnamed protein product [Moneuplotes crassus]|uniref:Uncharacterized protein n=1 Tax=Euplotes crassus TaxID=5936 RepID=A0AAD1UPK1_EUPCR|nr:unnamed protein product [Moneuplotes crassus]